MTTPNIDPRGLELFKRYGEFSEEEKRNSPEAAALMVEMMLYLPQEIQDQMHAMAVEMGLMPEKPSGYLEDGTPLYDLRETAKNLGVSDEDLDTQIAQMHAATSGKYKIDPSKIHRVQ